MLEDIKDGGGELLTVRRELLDRFEGCRIDFAKPPPPAEPRFSVVGRTICTPGNLTAIVAPPKAGKSAFIGAFVAAKIAAEAGVIDADTLGIHAHDASGRLLWIDSEQSREDAHASLARVLRRARLASAPKTLDLFSLAGTSGRLMREVVLARIQDAALSSAGEGGKLHSVCIDGFADLVESVNDESECNELVAELHKCAIAYSVPIIGVLHLNPLGFGGKGTGKSRGHLGSQLERKAESNLVLERDGEAMVVYGEKMRRAPIAKAEGPRFRWCDTVGMHVSTSAATPALCWRQSLVAQVFQDGAPKSHKNVVLGLAEASLQKRGKKLSAGRAESLFTEVRQGELIVQTDGGLWIRKETQPLTPIHP